MTKLTVILLLTCATVACADGPVFKNKDRFTQQEFDNVYQSIRTIPFSPLTVSTATITSSATIRTTLDMQSHKIVNLTNGTATADAAAYGQLKYFQAIRSSKTTLFSTTSSTYQDTSLSATITPTSSSNRIKLSFSGSVRTNNGNLSGVILTIKRGSTDIATGTFGFVYGDITATAVQQIFAASIVTVDSPATTSATTYTIFLKNEDNVTTVGLTGNLGQSELVAEEIQ